MSVVNETILSEIRARNIARVEDAKRNLGSLYTLHPNNRPIRKDLRNPILPQYLLKV